jgi:hypothetical protein
LGVLHGDDVLDRAVGSVAGDLARMELPAETGSPEVNVSDELDTEISGSGPVEYIGDPTVKQDVSGAGEVRKH